MRKSFVAVVRRGDVMLNGVLTAEGYSQVDALATALKSRAVGCKFFIARPDADRFASSTAHLTGLLGGTSFILQGLTHDPDDPLNDKLPCSNGWGPFFGGKGECAVVLSHGGTRMIRCVQSLGQQFRVPIPDIPMFPHRRLGHGFFLDLRQKTLTEI